MGLSMVRRGELLANRPASSGGPVDALLEAERRDPDAPLLIWHEGRWTVGEFADRARRWAGRLAELGIGRGDRVAVMSPNQPDFLALQYGIFLRGAVEVPINAERRGPMLAMVLEDADPELLIVDETLAEVTLPHAPEGARTVVIDDGLRAAVGRAEPDAGVRPEPGELAVILHTSGTTGPSKGVMIAHGYLPYHGATWAAMLDMRPGDVGYFPMPFFHVDAHSLFPACLLSGSALAFRPRFSSSRFWDDIVEFDATWFLAVGSMLSAVASRRGERPNRLRFVAGAPIPDEAYAYFVDELGLRLLQCYGQTEANLVVHCTPDRDRRRAMGVPVAGFDVAVVDEDDRPLPPGEIGRLVYRPTVPYSLTLGYWRRPEATLESARNLWWHSGDLARMDEDGFVYFAGRGSDSLRRRGENVSAWELETTVNHFPNVIGSAAVAVRDELGGEDEIKVFVILENEEAWDPEAFFAACEESLPRYSIPRFVEPIAEADIVRSPGNGSIQKHLLPKGHSERTVDRLAGTTRGGAT